MNFAPLCDFYGQKRDHADLAKSREGKRDMPFGAPCLLWFLRSRFSQGLLYRWTEHSADFF